MNDQAERLRRMVNPSNKEAKVIAVVSGKGGVGKSNVCLNFAISLSQLGKKVAIFDLDIGMANLDILMGISSKSNIMDVLDNDLSIFDIIEEGAGGISYIAGGSGFNSIVELDERRVQRFFTQLELIGNQYDFIFLDMGAGATKNSMQFVLSANEVFVITTPEPTAMTDAYAMVKYIYLNENEKPLYLIVNRTESEIEAKQTIDSFKKVAKQFLQKELLSLGHIPHDPGVSRAVKTQTPFVLYNQRAKASRAIVEIATNYLGIKNETGTRIGHFIKGMKRFLK